MGDHEITITLSRQDAENMLHLCDNMNYYSVGAALSRLDGFDEQKINEVFRSLCRVRYEIAKKAKTE